MPKGVYERTPEMKTGKYERTPEMKIGKYERTPEYCASLTGRTLPPETCVKMSNMATERHAKEMNPLPEGQSITIPKNKNCGSYLGCLTEELLALTFKDVKRMPFGNKGFDLICNRDFKIDIKSSATGYKGYWLFNIMKNTIADYFLCIAFESRDGITPTHVWLIPGKDINHITGMQISKTTIQKWSKYEQPLNRVLACCNVMKETWSEPKGL